MIKRIFMIWMLVCASIAQPIIQSPVGFGVSSTAVAAPVTNISLSSAITALTRTSPSGTTPMTWSITFASNVHEGDYLHLITYSDGTLSTIVKDVRHRLSHADMQPSAVLNFTADGFTEPTATQYLKFSVEAFSPLRLGYSFTYPTALSPTDAVTPMTWDNTNKTNTLTAGNLESYNSGGARGSRGIASGKFYLEFIGEAQFQLLDGSAVLGTDYTPVFAGGTPSSHAATYSSNASLVNYNTTNSAASGWTGAFFTASITGTAMNVSLVNTGALAIGQYIACQGAIFGTRITAGSGTSWTVDTSQTMASTANCVAGPIIQLAVDVTGNKIAWGLNNTWQASANPSAGTGMMSISGIGNPVYPGIDASNGRGGYMNAGTTPGGTTGGVFSPPTGYAFP